MAASSPSDSEADEAVAESSSSESEITAILTAAKGLIKDVTKCLEKGHSTKKDQRSNSLPRVPEGEVMKCTIKGTAAITKTTADIPNMRVRITQSQIKTEAKLRPGTRSGLHAPDEPQNMASVLRLAPAYFLDNMRLLFATVLDNLSFILICACALLLMSWLLRSFSQDKQLKDK